MPETPRRERGAGKTKEPQAGHAAGFGPRSLPGTSQPQHRRRAPLPRDPDTLPPLPAELWQVIDEGLAALDVVLSAGGRAAIDAHLRLLLAWNEHVNLTALRTPEQVARGHVVDSLSASAAIARLGANPRILDLGSGGGFPGLPLAVTLPASHCALLDSVRKKTAFLEVAADAARTALRTNGVEPPELQAVPQRAEDLASDPDRRASWDVVIARAVGSLAEVAELALPLTRVGGHVVAWKREAARAGLRDEINAAYRIVAAAGGSRPVVIAPDRAGRAGLADHRLVIVRKTRATPDRYPRPPAERRRSTTVR